MSMFDGLNTAAAQQAYAIANTPYSFLRRIQSDPVITELKRKAEPAALLAALRDTLSKEPKHLSEIVQPYLLLVALSTDLAALKEAADLPAPYCRWYRHIAPVLVQGFKATTRIILPGEIQTVTSTEFRTSTPTTTQTLVISK
jgi:hypothetical protein